MSDCEKCPVCLLELGEKNKMITLCGHTFCGSCFVSNLNFTIRCPMCRQDMVDVNSVQTPSPTVMQAGEAGVEGTMSTEYLRNRYSDIILQQLMENGGPINIPAEREITRIQIVNLLHSFELDLGLRSLPRPLSISDIPYQFHGSDSDSELDEILANLEIPEN